MLRGGIACLCVVLFACGGDDGGVTDAAGPDANDSGAGGPIEAAAPTAPDLLPCPSGWRELESGGVTMCEPWPTSGVVDCTGVEAHFPGESGCRRVGPPCPAGDLPTDLPPDLPVLYVLAGSTSGDGTQAAPYGRINEALMRAAAGAVVAVGRGTYDETVRPSRSVTIQGSCTEDTIITSSLAFAPSTGMIWARTNDVAVHGVRIEGGARSAVWVDAGASLTLSGVAIVDTAEVAIVVSGRIDADDILIRGTRSGAAGINGAGLLALAGSAELGRGAIEGNLNLGVGGVSGTDVTVHDTVIRGTGPRPVDSVGGQGLAAEGAAFTVRAVVVEDNHSTGLLVQAGGSVDAEDVVVRRTQPQVLDGNDGRGVNIAEAGSSGRLSRVLLSENHNSGLHAIGDVDVTVADAVVRRTGPDVFYPDGGLGLGVQVGATATVDRLWSEDNRVGVLVAPSASLVAHDLTVMRNGGHGIEVSVGSDAEITRALVEANRLVGVFAFDSTLRLTDLRVTETQASAGGAGGRGLDVESGAVLEASNLVFERNRDASLIAVNDASITATAVRIEETLERACAASGCPSAGMGVASAFNSSVDLADFSIGGSASCGVIVAHDGGMDLRDGEISENAIGACIQVDGYDVERLSQNVRYARNGLSLDTTDLPIPDGSTPTPTP